MNDVKIDLWDGIAAGVGMAITPMVIHLASFQREISRLLDYDEPEVAAGLFFIVVGSLILARRRWLNLPPRPARRGAYGGVALAAVVLGMVLLLLGAWLATLRFINAKEVSTTYVGMDTAKKSIQVAMLLPERDKPIEWEENNDARGLKRLKRKLQREAVGELRVCYEAEAGRTAGLPGGCWCRPGG